jgi:hypothetical protein
VRHSTNPAIPIDLSSFITVREEQAAEHRVRPRLPHQ